MNKIGIIMGSDSDLPIMQDAAKILDELQIPYELTIVSAHRTPEKLYEFAKSAVANGFGVIIAGAGGSAHLPGMTAALTPLPVIGVPIETKATKGIDSLLSIAQMPPGIPVATVAINGAKNAGILAASMLGIGDKDIQEKVIAYKKGMEKEVEEKAKHLEEISYERYLSEKQ